MWTKFILPSAVVLALAITLMVPSAYADPFVTSQKLEHKDINLVSVNPDGSRTYSMTPVPSRIWDEVTQKYAEYILTEDSTTVRLETGNAGSIEFNKNSCSYNLYKSGYIDELNLPQIGNMSWTVKGKEASSNTWSNVNSVNNAACSVSVQTTENTVKIIGEKSASSGKFQIVLDYVPGNGIKETFRAYNNNPAWHNHNIGFTEKIDVPRIIHFGNQTYDLANHNGTVLNRNWIENNNAKIIKFTDAAFYDFGIGFENLNDVKITWDGTKATLALNYLYPTVIVPYQTWFEIDPTLNFDTSGTTLILIIDQADAQIRGGNRISDTGPRGNELNSVVFRLYKAGTPTGNVVAELRNTSTDTLIATSTNSVDISTLTTLTSGQDVTFTFASPTIPNEDFRVVVLYDAGNTANSLRMVGAAASVANQQKTYTTNAAGTAWTDDPSQDPRGSLTYTIPPTNPPTNLSATSQARKVQYNWTQTDGTGITTYYRGLSLNNVTWTNKTSVGNVTSYLDSVYYRPGLLYYANVTATSAAGNSTSAYTSFTMDNYPSAPQNLYRTNTNATTTKLNWSPPSSAGGDTITGYRVERATGHTCTGFSILTNHTTALNYNNTGLGTSQQYCYRVAAWNGVGMGGYSNNVLRFALPSPILDLIITALGLNNIDISWSTPTLNGGTLSGYQINYTTPSGSPLTIVSNNTGSATTAYSVTGLTQNTPYCFRVGAWTQYGINASGNIVCGTTYVLANFTIGFFDVNATNPEQVPIRYERSELNATATNVKVIYPNNADLDCLLDFSFAQTQQAYNNINGSTYDVDQDYEDFVFRNSGNDIITIDCTNSNNNDTARYVVTQEGTFVLLDMIRDFRNGTYGTMGFIGSLDLITVIVVIISMIGFNRVSGQVGIIFNIFLIGVASYFEIISFDWIWLPALVLIAMVVILSTRKD